MVRDNFIRYLFIFSMLTAGFLFLAGCGKNNPAAPAGSPATIEGQVSGAGGYQRLAKSSAVNRDVSGASVILAQVNSEGSLQTVSNESVTTDSEGKFSVNTNLDGVQNIIVIATKNNEKWEAVVSTEVKAGTTVYCQPLNDETTSETEVYLSAKSKGDDNIGYDEIAVYIDSALAAQIKADPSLVSSVEASINASINAQQMVYAESEINISAADVSTIGSAKTRARASLDRNLYFSSDQSSIDAAFNAYNKDILNAYLDAGVSAVTMVKVLEISQRAFVNNVHNSGIRAEVKFEMFQNSVERKSELLNLAVQSEFSANADTQAQLNGLINAGSSLITSVEAASDNTQIIAAFHAYKSDLSAVLKITLGLDSGTYAALDSLVNDLRISLMTSVGTTASTDAIVAAYVNFYSRVDDAVLSVINSTDNSKAKLITNALIMLNTEF